VVKDSRVAEADNEQFLDLMEDYFNLSEEELKYVYEYSTRTSGIILIICARIIEGWTNDRK